MREILEVVKNFIRERENVCCCEACDYCKYTNHIVRLYNNHVELKEIEMVIGIVGGNYSSPLTIDLTSLHSEIKDSGEVYYSVELDNETFINMYLKFVKGDS